MSNSVFLGDYWSVDTHTPAITRFRFSEVEGSTIVEAWGSCFPLDCEWGETELFQLRVDEPSPDAECAFATWDDSELGPTHCLFTLRANELIVVSTSIRDGGGSRYRSDLRFCRDAARSAEALNPDPLKKFRHMWADPESGWRLVQYDTPVSFLEFIFDDEGPTRGEVAALWDYISRRQNETEDEVWERLRECSGIGLGAPVGPARFLNILQRPSETPVRVATLTIAPGEYLVLRPDGRHFDWNHMPTYRRPVVQQMLEAGCPIVKAHAD